jgi:UDP-N-acetylglucosamine kinase
MTGYVDRSRYVLSDEHNERIFRSDIVPAELGGTPQRHPVVVVVAGQTGAGKTSVTELVDQLLSRRGRPINLDLDTYKPHHPKYQDLVASDDRTVGAYTSIDGHKWMEKAEAYAIEQRFDVILESAMRDPRDFEDPVRRFRAAGYRVEVYIVAVHESLSRLGALDRYLQQVDTRGQGRLIDPAIHDACYRGVLRSADAIDRELLADEVFVGRRDGHIVHVNGLDDGNLRHPAGTREAVTRERERPLSDVEALRYLGALKRIHDLVQRLPAEVRAVAGPEAAAVVRLAEPLLADHAVRGQAAGIAEQLSPRRATPHPALPVARTPSPNPHAVRRMPLPAPGVARER